MARWSRLKLRIAYWKIMVCYEVHVAFLYVVHARVFRWLRTLWGLLSRERISRSLGSCPTGSARVQAHYLMPRLAMACSLASSGIVICTTDLDWARLAAGAFAITAVWLANEHRSLNNGKVANPDDPAPALTHTMRQHMRRTAWKPLSAIGPALVFADALAGHG